MKLKKLSKNIKSRILPYSRQYLDKEDIKSVCNVLKSDYLTQGNQVNKFEKRIGHCSVSIDEICRTLTPTSINRQVI